MPILIKGSGGAQKTPTISVEPGKITAMAGNKTATLTDSDFSAGNIMSGKNVFGVEGEMPYVLYDRVQGTGTGTIDIPAPPYTRRWEMTVLFLSSEKDAISGTTNQQALLSYTNHPGRVEIGITSVNKSGVENYNVIDIYADNLDDDIVVTPDNESNPLKFSVTLPSGYFFSSNTAYQYAVLFSV